MDTNGSVRILNDKGQTQKNYITVTDKDLYA